MLQASGIYIIKDGVELAIKPDRKGAPQFTAISNLHKIVDSILQGGSNDAYDKLFSSEDINYLKDHGDYLIPGVGARKTFNRFRFGGAFLFSVLMNWVWVLSLFSLLLCFLQGLFSTIPDSDNFWKTFGYFILVSSVITAATHFFLPYLVRFRLWSSGKLYFIEGLIFITIMAYVLYFATNSVIPIAFLTEPWKWFFASLATFIITGFFANPNIITLHAFYRDSISETYLRTETDDHRNLKLRDIIPVNNTNIFNAPYPLINCCLNVLGENDKYTGVKTSDYFLLSPLYCGSKLTEYVSTHSQGFDDLMLSTAVAISGAAVNPSTGTSTNRVLAFFMTLFNLRLGYWAINPKVKPFARIINDIVWWPYYHLLEMRSKTGVKRRRVNISDGGHIENLGVYELLRRRCKLIIAIDASADPNYELSDLRNIVIRARRELGYAITFRQDPEIYIRPKPSQGYSDSHFVIADIKELPRKNIMEEDKYKGLLVYLKSSLRPQKEFHVMAENQTLGDSFHYKSFHPAFPHESTVNQFFDNDQWEAYYNLGRYMAADLLRININKGEINKFNIGDLQSMFDEIKDGAKLSEHYEFYSS